MANKGKVLTAVAAVATAAALLLGGTFAWQSISQKALNEASDVINPGGRLHDDFNGENKDVYVENFAEEPIYARIRLGEYFEIIANYGKEGVESSTQVLGSKNEDDTYNYDPFYFDGNVDGDGVVTAGSGYWSWQTGGETVYMPTFNMNKDSLAADLNGNYVDAIGGISNRDGNQYENYVEYTADEELAGTEIYDADSNDIEDENTTTVEATHTAKATEYGELISMAEWDGTAGPYWVYDTDGWVYWAQAIEPDTATGLLLDGIALNQVMDDTWYYAIEVVAQFVTADDVGKSDGAGFYADGQAPTAEAEALLEAIGVDVSGEAGGEGEYEYTQETIDELNVRTASMDVYRGTQYTITYAYDGDVDSAYLYSVEMSSADGDHLSEVHCDGDEVVITVHPDEPNDTLTLTYTFDYDYSYEVEMTLNVLGDIGGEGEEYLEPTATLPVINITWSEETGNTASATVNRGEIYDFAGFQYVGMDANVHNDTLELSGGGDEEVCSYVGFDEYGNPLLVIEADEPNGTLLLTGSANMDETFDFVITLTVLDSETGGDEGMPEFTKDEDATASFTKYTDLVSDAAEYENYLYFEVGTNANEGPDPENITVQIFDKNGTPITLEDSAGRVSGTHQVQAYAITPVPEGTAEGDKFTGVVTWTVDGVTYGIAKAYYWVD